MQARKQRSEAVDFCIITMCDPLNVIMVIGYLEPFMLASIHPARTREQFLLSVIRSSFDIYFLLLGYNEYNLKKTIV